MSAKPRIAIIGSGISGLAAAHTLAGKAELSLFEAGDYFGGHTHTVDVSLPDHSGQMVTHGVDTGFLVFNERTYPHLIQLFADLNVATAKSDMSFSVQVPRAFGGTALEWSGSTLSTVFAQRSNLLRPRFWRMLRDLMRFNALCTQMAVANEDTAMRQPLGDFLKAHGFSHEFTQWYFLPMIGCIWSCPTDQMLQFPVATMVRFCHNHGLLQVTNRPQWWTVAGGAMHYVDKIVVGIADKRLNCPVRLLERHAQGVRVLTDDADNYRSEDFDHAIIATHSDQALAMLDAPSTQEQAVLGAVKYQSNKAVLHTDTSVLPQRRKAWAAWNYARAAASQSSNTSAQADARVCLHYWLNQLQPLPFAQDVVVSLNPNRSIARQHIMGEYDYAHPVFDGAAIAAQAQLPALQGVGNTYYCGAWTGYGFHEDGFVSGMAAAQALLAKLGAA
jgi:uncharacterized protein